MLDLNTEQGISAVSEKDLPETAQKLVALIGLPKTARLIDQLGGTTFPVSKNTTKMGQLRYELLAEAVGVDAADILTQEFGGVMLYIPNCSAAIRAARNRAIHEAFDRMTATAPGESKPLYSSNEAVFNLARSYQLSDRRIWAILKELPESNDRQMGMFG